MAHHASRSHAGAGATMLACADIEEGIVLRQAGVRVPILVFGALSVSDLDGLFDFSLTPTISTPGAARAVQARRRCGVDDRLPPEDRHRHEPARVPSRQPARTLPGTAGQREPATRRRLHTLRIAETCRESGVHHAARTLRRRLVGRRRGFRAESRIPTIPSRPSAPAESFRHACNSAALLRDSRVWFDAVRPGLLLYGIVPPPLGVNHRSQPGDVAHEPRRRSQRIETGRGRRLRLAVQASEPRRSPSFPPATPMDSTRGCADAATC